MKVILVLMIAILAQAGMFSVITSIDMKSLEPQAKYKINTAGFNPRVYEFNTVIKPILHCIVIFSSSDGASSPALQCQKVK